MTDDRAKQILREFVVCDISWHEARKALLSAPTTEEVVEGVLEDLRDHKTTVEKGVARIFEKADD